MHAEGGKHGVEILGMPGAREEALQTSAIPGSIRDQSHNIDSVGGEGEGLSRGSTSKPPSP